MNSIQPQKNNPLISLGQFGERARPLRDELREAALVVGLGQVGLYAVARVREMINALATRREVQNKIRLMAIMRHRVGREERLLPREERLMLTMDPVSWYDVPGRYAAAGVAKWWPLPPRAPEILRDLTQVRAYNRLALFDDAKMLSDTLFDLARWLHETNRDQKLERRIYVLASLAEPEGSALIFDVVTRLRALCAPRPTTIIGMFALTTRELADNPANDLDGTMAMATVYATLRELDAYTLHPNTFPSTLPAFVEHAINEGVPQRALDMVLLADDAANPSGQPPEHVLAECVTTWIAASLLPEQHAAQLPDPIPLEEGTDRFTGYSTIGVSKLALPTRAAMDLAAIGLAQATLNAAKLSNASTPTNSWVSQVMTAARAAIIDADLSSAMSITNWQHEWSYELGAAALGRKLELRAAKNETIGMVDLVRMEAPRPQREGTPTTQLTNWSGAESETLRSRIDTLLEASVRDLREMLSTSLLDLAYVKGYGLLWTANAIDDLERQVTGVLSQSQNLLPEVKAVYQNSYQAFVEAARQYDSQTGSRFGSGRKPVSAELDACGQTMLDALIELIALQARQDMWTDLIRLIQDLRNQVREAIPVIEQTNERLRDIEVQRRQAMEVAAFQPPQYPAGVMLTNSWYMEGIQDIASMAQLTPRQLLSQVFSAWGQTEVPRERQLVTFLREVLDAARRALAGVFRFSDLYEFLSQNQGHPAFRQAVIDLPDAATPALTTGKDDKHPAPQMFEIIREVSRPFSAIGDAPRDIIRTFVPSPDSDESTVIRVLHGLMAEALPDLREKYRRAYDRTGAEGMPLHIDRLWDSTMADLVHTTERREISTVWENILLTQGQGPEAVQQPVDQMIRLIGVALNVLNVTLVPNLPADMRLVLYKLRPGRIKLPPPTCAVAFVFSNRSPQEIGEMLLRAISHVSIEEPFLFLVNNAGRQDIEQVAEPLRREDYMVLVLDEADTKHLVSARDPIRALNDLVLSRVDLTTVSPFYTRGPVPEHMFFGREHEIHDICSKLHTHSVALIGGRRIGKTSMLQRVAMMLSMPDSDCVPYYLDCNHATDYSSLFWLINRRWQVPIDQNASPIQFEDVIAALQAQHANKSIVILIDEIDSLLYLDRQPENQETLFRTFRSLSNEKRCQFVFCGHKWLMAAIEDASSVLFNFAQMVHLKPLPLNIVRQMVVESFEMLNIWLEESDKIIDRIYQISAGHPNIVQMICQGMIEELDQEGSNINLLSYAHLDRATARRQLQEQIVQTIWGQMGTLAKLVTLIWPENVRYLTLTEIVDLLHQQGLNTVTYQQMERTAKYLELYCFVRPRENDRLELIPMAFPVILDFMTSKKQQIEKTKQQYESELFDDR